MRWALVKDYGLKFPYRSPEYQSVAIADGKATVTLDDQVTPTRIARWASVADQYDTRMFALKQKSRVDSVYKPAPPASLYLDEAGWDAAIAGRRVMQFGALKQASGPNVIDAGGRIGRDFAPERQQEQINLFGALVQHIRSREADGPVVIASYSEGARERLSGLLEDEGIGETIEIGRASCRERV